MKPRPPSSTGTATLLPYTTLFRSEAEAAGGRGLAHVADVTDPAAVDGMVAATLAAFGRIDFLVSNAALRRQTPFLDMAFDEWREIDRKSTRLNSVTNAHLVCRLLLEKKKKKYNRNETTNDST